MMSLGSFIISKETELVIRVLREFGSIYGVEDSSKDISIALRQDISRIVCDDFVYVLSFLYAEIEWF